MVASATPLVFVDVAARSSPSAVVSISVAISITIPVSIPAPVSVGPSRVCNFSGACEVERKVISVAPVASTNRHRIKTLPGSHVDFACCISRIVIATVCHSFDIGVEAAASSVAVFELAREHNVFVPTGQESMDRHTAIVLKGDLQFAKTVSGSVKVDGASAFHRGVKCLTIGSTVWPALSRRGTDKRSHGYSCKGSLRVILELDIHFLF